MSFYSRSCTKLSHTCLPLIQLWLPVFVNIERKSHLNNLCLCSTKTTTLSHNNFSCPLCAVSIVEFLYISHVLYINAITYSYTPVVIYISYSREGKLCNYVCWWFFFFLHLQGVKFRRLRYWFCNISITCLRHHLTKGLVTSKGQMQRGVETFSQMLLLFLEREIPELILLWSLLRICFTIFQMIQNVNWQNLNSDQPKHLITSFIQPKASTYPFVATHICICLI